MEDSITSQVHHVDGLLKTGPNAPVLTCLSSWGEIGKVPLESQTVLWLGAHVLSEGSNVLEIPGTGATNHQVLTREDWDIIVDLSSNLHLLPPNGIFQIYVFYIITITSSCSLHLWKL